MYKIERERGTADGRLQARENIIAEAVLAQCTLLLLQREARLLVSNTAARIARPGAEPQGPSGDPHEQFPDHPDP